MINRLYYIMQYIDTNSMYFNETEREHLMDTLIVQKCMWIQKFLIERIQIF